MTVATVADFSWFEVACVDSTNLFLREKVRAGDVSQAAVWAREQNAGRGRLGRTWLSPEGGLYLSLSVPIHPSHNPHLYTMAVAVSVAEYLAEEYQVNVGLKWPNDIVAVVKTTDGPEEERKMGGILAELIQDAPHGSHVVVGLGLNINTPISLVDPQNNLAPISLCEWYGRSVDLASLTQQLVQQIGRVWNRRNQADWPEEIHAQAKRWIRTLGQRVRITLQDTVLEGQAVDLSPTLGLYLKDDLGNTTEVHSGDCIHLRLGKLKVES